MRTEGQQTVMPLQPSIRFQRGRFQRGVAAICSVALVTISSMSTMVSPALAETTVRIGPVIASTTMTTLGQCDAASIVGRVGKNERPGNATRASGALFDCLAEFVERGQASAGLALLTEVITAAPGWPEPFEQRYLHRAAASRAQLADATPAGVGCVKSSAHAQITTSMQGALSDLQTFRGLASATVDDALLASEQAQLEKEITSIGDRLCQCGGRDAQLAMCADSPEVAAAKAKTEQEQAATEQDSAAQAELAAQAEQNARTKKPNLFQRVDAKMPADRKTKTLYYAGAGAGFVGIVLGVVSLPFIVRGGRLAKRQLQNNQRDPELDEQGFRSDRLAMGFGITGAALVLGGAAMILTPMLMRKGTGKDRVTARRGAWLVVSPTHLEHAGPGVQLSGRF